MHATGEKNERTYFKHHYAIRAHSRMEKSKGANSIGSTELTFNAFKAGSQDKTIAELDCVSKAIPYSKGFSPSSYKNVTNFQLLKKRWHIRCQSVENFNMINKKIGKEVI